MNTVESLTRSLRAAFCEGLEVTMVPAGYAVNTGLPMPDGDLLTFYVVSDDEGAYHFEDDGTTLPSAIAAGLDLKSPMRESLLNGMLAEEGARLDDDLAIRSSPLTPDRIGAEALRFMSAIIRTRDLALLSRENVAATFADDVRNALVKRLPSGFSLEPGQRQNDPTEPDMFVHSPETGLKVGRIFAAGGDLRLMEALVGFHGSGDGDSPVIAVVDRRKNHISEKRFNVATNRGLPMAVVDGSGDDWIHRVLQLLDAPAVNHHPL